MEVVRNRFALQIVDIKFCDVLREHEAVSAHTGEESQLRVYDVAWLNVITAPYSLESDTCEFRNPAAKDFGNHLDEFAVVNLQVLVCLFCINCRRGTADNLSCLCKLLSVNCREAVLLAAVD